MITAAKSPGIFFESFHQLESRTHSAPPWLRRLRREAFARWSHAGFPTTHDEDWRFTSLAPITALDFHLAPPVPQLSREQLAPLLPRDAARCLVFLNGHFAPQLSQLSSIAGASPAEGLTIGSLAQALGPEQRLLQPHFARYLDQQRDSFCALNTAFAEDGAYIHLARGAVVEGPIWLLYLTVPDAGVPLMSHPRNLIVAGEESQLCVVEEYVTLNSGGGSGSTLCNTLCNAVTELAVADHAIVSHYRIEREQTASFNVSTLRIQQGRNASVSTHVVLLGGALVRNNVHAVLAGEGGECLLNGLFLGGAAEHLDNFMLVEHASPHCGSRQFYNGVLEGHAHGVFHGRIVVHKDAQKTDARQTNRNLLLSDDAQIDTKPQLEIHADDVKCTHGAAIGQIDDDALFYLRSRGIAEASARQLLLLAFTGECLSRMKEDAPRRHAEALVRHAVLHLTGAGPQGGEPLDELTQDFAPEGSEAPLL